MNTRVTILSDTHLGHPNGGINNPRQLQPLWQNTDHLIINGDAAEVHHPRYRDNALQQLMQLVDLAEADNVAVTLIPGNHDPFISETRHLHLHNRQILVTHGDALHPDIVPWSHNAHRIRTLHQAELQKLDTQQLQQLEHRLHAAQAASHAEWYDPQSHPDHSTVAKLLRHPFAVCRVLRYWWAVPKLAAQFAADYAPAARFIIMGHSHRQGVWHVGDKIVINTGSYGFPGKPWAVRLDNHQLTVQAIRRNAETFTYAHSPVAQFDLHPPNLQAEPAPALSA